MKFIYQYSILLILLIFTGCDDAVEDIPIFGGTTPFRIIQIEFFNDSLDTYTASYYHPSWTHKSHIVAKRGLFKIGDTVCVNKPIH